MRPLRPLLALLLALAAAGCDSGEPDARSLVGVWAGTVTNDAGLAASVELDIDQIGTALTGSVSWQLGAVAVAGTLAGTLPAAGTIPVTIDLRELGIYTFVATLRGDGLSGTWTNSFGQSGTFSLRRVR